MMKKTISIITALIITMLCAAGAMAYEAVTLPDYTFASGQFGVSDIDTDGNIFVGIKGGRVCTSTDFQSWDINSDIPPADMAVYIGGNFCAVSKGQTSVSTDGVSWKSVENNLPAPIGNSKNISKINGTVTVFVNDYEGNAGTYWSRDGISWTMVENFPDGITLYNVNGLLMGESHEYMRGIYVSSDGMSFERIQIPNYTESYGGMNVTYDGEKYIVRDYWREIDDEKYCYIYTSPDLHTWSESIAERGETARDNALNVRIGGELHSFDTNGGDLVYKDGNWAEGQYNMMTPMGGTGTYNFVFYNCTDYGILAWSSSYHCYFIGNDGSFEVYDGRSLVGRALYMDEGGFHVVCEDESLWKYTEGVWKKEDAKFTYDMYTKNMTASNGEVTLTSEFIERGSWAGYEGNKEIRGTLEYPDGRSETVVYEYGYDDYVDVCGGDGFFLLSGFSSQGYCYSPDGITRYDTVSFPDKLTQLVMDKNVFMYADSDFILHIGSSKQFKELELPAAVRVKYNGEYISFAAPPVIREERTLIPVRFLFELMGAEVEWNAEEQSAVISYNGTTVKVTIGSSAAIVNGEEKTLDSPAQLIGGKTMIPLRFISEELGFKVDWNEAERTVTVM